MSSQNPSSITAEEVVARMINRDGLCDGLSLIDDLSIETEEAKTNYNRAKIDGTPEEKIDSLKRALVICRARETIARCLLDEINNEFWNREESMLVISSVACDTPSERTV